MSFVKYQNTNNASSLLIADITASQTTILITDWDQWLFPSSFPFLLTIEHLDASENVILREIVKVVSSNQNSFTVERSSWICVQDDTATNRVQDNTAHAFYSWDKISLYWTAEQVADIQNNLELKANQDSIANVYDNTATYSVGDIVVYKGDRYVCSTAVSTPEDFDSTKWTKVNVQYDLNQQDLRIDNIEQEIQSLWGAIKVDVLVLGWWGAWWAWYYSWWVLAWWGWGAWELKIIEWFVIREKSQTITIWSWWIWACSWRGNNWCPSKFWYLVAQGWGGWGWYSSTCWNTTTMQWWDGANWWWAWWSQTNSSSINYNWWNATVPWWHAWQNGVCNMFWWGWWGVWTFIFNLWMTDCNQATSYANTAWWRWVATCFWWTLRRVWGWGWRDSCWIWWSCFWWWQQTTSADWYSWSANTWWWWGWGRSTANWVNRAWGSGWSWLVIVRYPKDCSYWIKCATWGTITTPTIDGIQYVVHTFTSNWTFCITESV